MELELIIEDLSGTMDARYIKHFTSMTVEQRRRLDIGKPSILANLVVILFTFEEREGPGLEDEKIILKTVENMKEVLNTLLKENTHHPSLLSIIREKGDKMYKICNFLADKGAIDFDQRDILYKVLKRYFAVVVYTSTSNSEVEVQLTPKNINYL